MFTIYITNLPLFFIFSKSKKIENRQSKIFFYFCTQSSNIQSYFGLLNLSLSEKVKD